jgi:hypothetical protein
LRQRTVAHGHDVQIDILLCGSRRHDAIGNRVRTQIDDDG